jgi:alpha-mannosidase
MADLLLVCEGETARTFRFGIGIDLAYPIPAALDLLEPVHVIAATTGPPVSGPTGWFFHLDAKNVVVTRVAPADDSGGGSDSQAPQPGRSVVFHLIETEGRPVRANLRCFETPRKARQIDFRGNTLSELTVAGDAVVVDLTSHEIARVVVAFES